ncbi:SAC3_3 [Sanghuangporus weigelae]
MCPEFERYRRERVNNLDKWECIIVPDGKPTKEVDHARTVKIYERGQGDKIIPSDLRRPPVLKRTLDYLFHDLIPRGGFAETQAFVWDRSRAQLMNSLLSLKEFYDDQRGKDESPNELEMRIYHRLGLIRDQHERNDRPPLFIAVDPASQLISHSRSEVQAASNPITRISKLRANGAAMQTFAELASVLRERQNEKQDETSAFIQEDEGAVEADDILDTSQPDDGPASTQEQTLSQSRSAPGPELSSASPFGRPTTQTTFVPVPAAGLSSVFGTAFNTFQSAPNVFGGPVFGVPATSSSASPKIVEPPKPAVSAFPPRPPSTSKPAKSITPSTSTILQETKPLRSLADVGPLLSEGEEDRVSSSEAVRTPAPPPFSTSQSAPTLNPFAQALNLVPSEHRSLRHYFLPLQEPVSLL